MRFVAVAFLFVLLSLTGQAQQTAPSWTGAEVIAPGVGGNNGVCGNSHIAPGPDDSRYVAGWLDGRVTVPGQGAIANTASGFFNSYVGQQVSTGQWQWLKVLTNRRGYRIAIDALRADAQRNLYVAASIYWGATGFPNELNDTVQLGSLVLMGHSFVGKISPAGQWIWSTALPHASIKTMVPDERGGVFLVGTFDEVLNLGGFSLVDPSGNQNVPYMGHLGATGQGTWAVQGRQYAVDAVQSIALTPSGHLMVGGIFGGSVLSLSPSVQVQGRPNHANLYLAQLDTATKQWRWATGARGVDRMGELVVDRYGNTIVSGLFFDSVYFGATRLRTIYPIEATYVAKVSATGQWQWATRHTGNTYYSNQQELALTPTGNVLLSGTIRGDTARFGSVLLQDPPTHHWAYPWGYVAQLNGNTGQWQWAVATPNELPGATDIIVDSAGTSAVLVGSLFPSRHGTQVGTTTLSAPLASSFVVSLSLATRQWLSATGMATGGGTEGQYVGTDARGNLTASGLVYGEVGFGPHYVLEPYQGMFVGQRSPQGTWQWVVSGEGFWPAKAIRTDARGNVYLLGYLNSRVDTARIGAQKLTYRPWYRQGVPYAIAKITASGQVAWVHQLWMRNGSFNDRSITVDARGNITLAGSFWDSLRIDNRYWRSTLVPHTARRSWDGFIVRFDTQGTLKWINRTTNKLDEAWYQVATDRRGGATLIGSLSSDTVRLGSLQFLQPPADSIPTVLAHLDSLGQWQWALPIQNGGISGWDMVADSHDNLWLTGNTSPLRHVHIGSYNIRHSPTRHPTNVHRFVALFNRLTRQVEWTRNVSGLLWSDYYSWASSPQPLILTCDDHGNAYAAGLLVDSMRWGNTTLVAEPSSRLGRASVIVKLDSLGRLEWGAQSPWRRISNVHILDIAASGPDGVYATGTYDSDVSFDGRTLPNDGLYNGFLATIGNVVPVVVPPLVSEPSAFELWPNPATLVAHLRLPSTAPTDQPIELIDPLGRVVRQWPGGYSADLPLTGVAIGLYVVRCGKLSCKLLVQ